METMKKQTMNMEILSENDCIIFLTLNSSEQKRREDFMAKFFLAIVFWQYPVVAINLTQEYPNERNEEKMEPKKKTPKELNKQFIMPLIQWTCIYVTHSSQNFYLLFLLLPACPRARVPAFLPA